MPLSNPLIPLTNYADTRSWGAQRRAKRLQPLLTMIEAVFEARGSVRLLDVGGREVYWQLVPEMFLNQHRVSITIVNLPCEQLPADHGRFTFVVGDACEMAGVHDHAYDIVHANSVIEHVGDWARMVRFAQEVRRLAPRYFVQTPNFWFPVEPHCLTPLFHWLPVPTRAWLVRHFQLGHWGHAQDVDESMNLVESARLLSRPMLKELFPDATILTERLCGLPKSLVAVR